ncbi:cystatin-1-like [Amphiura filiformis]|uniref:cystatin-1-like n=1 Tax=Amphiura filiformis TaxID=82378 RepID=UPI003B212307
MTPSQCFLSVLLAVAVILSCLVCHASKGLGGGRKADVKDEQVQKAVHFAETEINKMSNSYYYMMVTKVVKAEQQLVSGMNYFLTLEMTSTDCKKNTKFPTELDSCKPSDNKNAHATQLCDVTVWVKAWIKNGTSLSDLSCRPPK